MQIQAEKQLKYGVVASLAIIALAIVAIPLLSASATSTTIPERDKTAVGVWVKEEGTTRTVVDIFVTANQTYLQTYQYDSNTGIIYSYTSNPTLTPIKKGEFTMSGLNTESLTTSINASSDLVGGGSKTFNVNVQWTGTGDIIRGNSSSTYDDGVTRIIIHSNGSNRGADATVNLSSDTISFSSSSPVTSAIGVENSGTITVTTK